MNTAERVIENIRQEEIDGKHERTYLLFDALDMLCSDNVTDENREDLNNNLDYRLSYFINAGANEARKEILVIGGIVLVCIGGYKLVKKYIYKKKNKMKLEEKA